LATTSVSRPPRADTVKSGEGVEPRISALAALEKISILEGCAQIVPQNESPAVGKPAAEHLGILGVSTSAVAYSVHQRNGVLPTILVQLAIYVSY